MMTRKGCSKKTKTKNGPNNHHTIKTYVEAVKKDIEESKTVPAKKMRPNLIKVEKIALKELSKRDKIFINNAEKSGTVVIMGVNDYIREAKRQLNDQ